jgi:hypothetical protein
MLRMNELDVIIYTMMSIDEIREKLKVLKGSHAIIKGGLWSMSHKKSREKEENGKNHMEHDTESETGKDE